MTTATRKGAPRHEFAYPSVDRVLRYFHSDRTKNLVVFKRQRRRRHESQIYRAPANLDELENIIVAAAIRSRDLCLAYSDRRRRGTIITALPDICAVPALHVWLRFAIEDFAKLLSRVELAVRSFIWEKCVCDECVPDDDDLDPFDDLFAADYTEKVRSLHRNIGIWNSASFALVLAWLFERLANQRSDAFERESTRLAELFDLCLGTGNVLLALPFGCAVSRNRIEPSIRAFLKSHSRKPDLEENLTRMQYYAEDGRDVCHSDGFTFYDDEKMTFSDDGDDDDEKSMFFHRDHCPYCLPSVSSDWVFLAAKMLTIARYTHVTLDNYSPWHYMRARVRELRLRSESMLDLTTLAGRSAHLVSQVQGIPGAVRMPRPWRRAILRYFRRVSAIVPVELLSNETTLIDRRLYHLRETRLEENNDD